MNTRPNHQVAARRAASLLTSTGMSVASVRALDYLRQAVVNRQASAEVLQYIRT